MNATFFFILGSILALSNGASFANNEQTNGHSTTKTVDGDLNLIEIEIPPKNPKTAEPDLKQNVISAEKDDAGKKDREDSSRSIDVDVDKYVSDEFHDRNNVYTVSVSPDTEKYLDPSFELRISPSFPPSTPGIASNFENSPLTTPESAHFDSRYKDVKQSLEQISKEEEEVDNENGEDEEDKDLEAEKLLDEPKASSESDPNVKHLISEYKESRRINRNDSVTGNKSKHDLSVEQSKQVHFRRIFNDSKSYQEGELETATKTSTSTAGNRNSLSNSIETTMKKGKDQDQEKISVQENQIVPVQVSAPDSQVERSPIGKGVLPVVQIATPSAELDSSKLKTTATVGVLEKSSQVEAVESRAESSNKTAAENIDVSTETGSYSTSFYENVEQTTGISFDSDSVNTKFSVQQLASVDENFDQTTRIISDFDSTEFVFENAETTVKTLASLVENVDQTTKTFSNSSTDSDFISENTESTETLELTAKNEKLFDIFPAKISSLNLTTTENYLLTTTELTVSDIHEETTTLSGLNSSPNFEIETPTTFEPTLTTTESTQKSTELTLKSFELSQTTTESTITTTELTQKITESTTKSSESLQTTESTQATTELTSKSTESTPRSAKSTPKSTESTTKSSESLQTTESTQATNELTTKSTESAPRSAKSTPKSTESTQTTTELPSPLTELTSSKFAFAPTEQTSTKLHLTPTVNSNPVETVDNLEDRTTLSPSAPSNANPSSNVNFKTLKINEVDRDREVLEAGTESPIVDDGSEDRKGTIAAIVISSVGAACLVLLAGLLYVMRKRQKRFNYARRCNPVGMDDYSVDNVSVYNSVRRKELLRASKRSYGNAAFEDPSAVSHPLTFQALAKFASDPEQVKAEFEEVPQVTARTDDLPEGCEAKNRYANVIPLPETRVALGRTDDYINANYVTGPGNAKRYYIACQAPMRTTADDFWLMVWEQQSRVILMLTHLFENGVEKCSDYLPPAEVLDRSRPFGDFQVTLKKQDAKENYVISTLQLKNMVSNSWREVTHFWYLGWPEKGVPTEASSLIAFLLEARSCMAEAGPAIVHCSPGTGRTGCVIACDIAIREFEQARLVDIPKVVYRIRRDRASAVQTKEQYTFIYKVVSLYATKLTGGALDSF